MIDLFFKLLLIFVSVQFVRTKTDEISREMLKKTIDELRNQIGDRDRTSIGLREQISTLTQRVNNIQADLEYKRSEVMALLEENLSLKTEIKRLGPKKG